ncbi:hypothetical protein ERJ75_001038800 [Trypanosoma vivax]|nr:hypothetical protein TRVL_05309 [Trypanosoma vivax]KAH8610999.1 hypothetical protein ERJ75_001038800 [Trypanosoma vivax]
MPTNPRNNHEALQARFVEASRSLAKLYRDSTCSYETGYRDALIMLRCYILKTAFNVPPTTAGNTLGTTTEAVDRNSGGGGGDGSLAKSYGCYHDGHTSHRNSNECSQLLQARDNATVKSTLKLDANKTLQFIRSTLKHRDDMAAASRGTKNKRKRTRSVSDRSHCDSVSECGLATLSGDFTNTRAGCQPPGSRHSSSSAWSNSTALFRVRELSVSRPADAGLGVLESNLDSAARGS